MTAAAAQPVVRPVLSKQAEALRGHPMAQRAFVVRAVGDKVDLIAHLWLLRSKTGRVRALVMGWSPENVLETAHYAVATGGGYDKENFALDGATLRGVRFSNAEYSGFRAFVDAQGWTLLGCLE